MKIWTQTAKTALFITHDIDEAIYLADRVIVFTARPARVKESVPIELPRPRPLQVKRDPRFQEYVDRVWASIQEEVNTSLQRELGR
jgi:NitT/TauT family transport system ATP-binding protein